MKRKLIVMLAPVYAFSLFAPLTMAVEHEHENCEVHQVETQSVQPLSSCVGGHWWRYLWDRTSIENVGSSGHKTVTRKVYICDYCDATQNIIIYESPIAAHNKNIFCNEYHNPGTHSYVYQCDVCYYKSTTIFVKGDYPCCILSQSAYVRLL
jgi:hypothetical protein